MNLCWKIKCGIVLVLLVAVAGLQAEPLATGTNQLFLRTFQVSASDLWQAVANEPGLPAGPGQERPAGAELVKEVREGVREYISGLGVSLNPPKSLFYNDRLALLFVKATEPDLDVIEPRSSRGGDACRHRSPPVCRPRDFV